MKTGLEHDEDGERLVMLDSQLDSAMSVAVTMGLGAVFVAAALVLRLCGWFVGL